MVDPLLQRELASKEAKAELSVLLEFETPAELERKDFIKIPVQERRRRMVELYGAVKAPVFNDLKRIQGVRLQDMPTSGSAVLTTTVACLRTLLGKSGVLGSHEEVRVFPNVRVEALSSAA